MPNPYAAIFKPSKSEPGQYIITIARNAGDIVIPGFRLYQGSIQPPRKKYKSNWYSMVYYSREEATNIYSAIVLAAPDGTYLLPIEAAIAPLLHNPAILSGLE